MDEVAELKPRACFEFEVEKILGVSDDGRYQVQWAWVSMGEQIPFGWLQESHSGILTTTSWEGDKT